MELTSAQSLAYLAQNGYTISLSTLVRARKKLRDSEHRWSSKLALDDGLLDQHIRRIQKLEVAERELWLIYLRILKDKPERAAGLLPGIVSIQPYISGAYRSIRNVLESQAALKKRYAIPLPSPTS